MPVAVFVVFAGFIAVAVAAVLGAVVATACLDNFWKLQLMTV